MEAELPQEVDTSTPPLEYMSDEELELEKTQALAASRVVLMKYGTLKEKMACAQAVRQKAKMKKRAEKRARSYHGR